MRTKMHTVTKMKPAPPIQSEITSEHTHADSVRALLFFECLRAVLISAESKRGAFECR